jgi:hypothetical protein
MFFHSKPGKSIKNYSFRLQDGCKRDSVILELSKGYYENFKKHFEPVFSQMQTRTFEEVNKKWAYQAIDLFKQQKNGKNSV